MTAETFPPAHSFVTRREGGGRASVPQPRQEEPRAGHAHGPGPAFRVAVLRTSAVSQPLRAGEDHDSPFVPYAPGQGSRVPTLSTQRETFASLCKAKRTDMP